MSGIEIYNEYQKKRDYSGSESDQYAQDLETMYNSCYQNGEESEFLELLLEAHNGANKLVVLNDDTDIITFADITIQN